MRNAADAKWLGAELSLILATELLKSRQRSGQRRYVDVEAEGQPTEEPPADTTRCESYSGSCRSRLSVQAPIPEEGDSMDITIPEIVESGPEIRSRQTESEPGSEPADRKRHTTPDEVLVDNPSGEASALPISLPFVSASNYFDSSPS